jgi:adenine-specific DNA methylase
VRLLGELEDAGDLPIPDAEIPAGDETKRLHRWGYQRYRDMFSARQLPGLGLLLRRIRHVSDEHVRHALLTVFSDILRYQNMLCRYDTYALKCRDIFAVHGFPVGLNQCEANLLGIPGVGAGGFRHFVEKYRRAKSWCREPFEKRREGKKSVSVPVYSESVETQPVSKLPAGARREAFLNRAPAAEVPVQPGSLDGVFSDPPYFDNVQYAELMDFCYVWLRQVLADEFTEFRPSTTQSGQDLTGNKTLGRGLEHFTQGLSEIFSHYGSALKPGAPFVFTYHHNKIAAYTPLVVAMLDAGLACTAVLPAPGEMEASLHIHGTGSSVLDSVFILRAADQGLEDTAVTRELPEAKTLEGLLAENLAAVAAGGVKVTLGDARCLFSGHVARLCSLNLSRTGWDAEAPLDDRLARVREELDILAARYGAPEKEGGTPARAVVLSKELDRRDQIALFAGGADGDS